MRQLNTSLVSKVRRILLNHAVRSTLEDYFEAVDISLDSPIYPPVLRDLQASVPLISGVVEVKPHVVELNPLTEGVRVGWNLFVLGMFRLYLGTSIHESMEHLGNRSSNSDDLSTSERYTTPKKLINFIIDILNEHGQNTCASQMVANFKQPQIAAPKSPPSGAYYEKSNQAIAVARWPH